MHQYVPCLEYENQENHLKMLAAFYAIANVL